MADRPAPMRLSLPQQAVVNLCGLLACQIFDDSRRAAALAALARILPAARADLPAGFGPVMQAAEAAARHGVARAAGEQGARDWALFAGPLGRAMADFFWHRAGLALDAATAKGTPDAA